MSGTKIHLALDREEALAMIEMLGRVRTLPANARPHTDLAHARLAEHEDDRMSYGAFLRAAATGTGKLVDALYPTGVDAPDPRD